MRRLLPCLLLGAFAAAVPACDTDSRIVTMRIDHYQDPCWDQRPGFCLRVIDPEEDSLSQIGGYEHDWGIVSEIVVMATDNLDGTTDYDLVEVVSREPVPADARFEMQLNPDFIERVNSHSFELVSDKPVRCETEEVCRAVSQAMFDGLAFDVELGYAETGTSFIAYGVELRESS